MEKNTMQCKKKTLGWVLVRLHGTWGDSLSGWGSCGKCFGILNIFVTQITSVMFAEIY